MQYIETGLLLGNSIFVNILHFYLGHRMTFEHYHRMDDIHGYLDYLAQTYPKLVSTEEIGTSVENRPLKIIKISAEEPTGKAMWIDGGKKS